MIVGYARTSTVEQSAGLESQVQELDKSGCKKIYKEQVSSQAKRIKLLAALDFVREGDVFVVTKLDRLARSMKDLMNILDTLSQKGVAVRILNLGLDTQTPTGKLILNVLGGIAQFEREMMLERQREGIAKAKAENKYTGRKPVANEIRERIVKLVEEGNTREAVAGEVGVGVATVYRVLAANGISKNIKTL